MAISKEKLNAATGMNTVKLIDVRGTITGAKAVTGMPQNHAGIVFGRASADAIAWIRDEHGIRDSTDPCCWTEQNRPLADHERVR